MSLLINSLLVFLVITTVMVLGRELESRFRVMPGIGPILALINIEILFSLLALNPFGTETFWRNSSRITWLFLFIYALVLFKNYSKRKLLLLSNIIIIPLVLYFIAQPGERSWDGAGYHNVISFLISENGSYWGWPNLMWAQWFPANQETLGASFLQIFNGNDGLVVPNLIWLSLVFNLFIEYFREYKAVGIFAALSLLFSIPVFLSQATTSYVDIQTGMSFVAGILIISKMKNARFQWLWLGIAACGLTSTKWSGFALVAILGIYATVHEIEEKTKRKSTVISIIVGSLFGIFPIALRNILEFHSATHPFKGPFGIWPGLFDQSVMTKQIGIANMPINFAEINVFEQLFIEYIYSPLKYCYELWTNIFSGKIFDYLESSQIGLYSTYDARLGGVGVILISCTILATWIQRKSVEKLIKISILVIPFFFFPMTWWARYYFALPLSILLTEVESISSFLKNSRLMKYLFTILATASTVIAPFSVGTHIIEKNSWPSSFGYAGKVADTLGPECRNILVVGEGLTFSSGLWGAQRCNSIIGSLHFGNAQESLGQFGSLPSFENSNLEAKVDEYLVKNKNLTLIIADQNISEAKWVTQLVSHLKFSSSIKSYTLSSESNAHGLLIIEAVAKRRTDTSQ